MASQETGVAGLFRGVDAAARGKAATPGEEVSGPLAKVGAPGRRVGDRWRSGLRARNGGGGVRGEEEGAFGKGWRDGARGEERPRRGSDAREEERRPIRLGRSGPEWGRRCREEGGTAAILGPQGGGGGRGMVCATVPREEEGHRRCTRHPGRRAGARWGWAFAARNGGGGAREEGGTAADHKPREEERARDGLRGGAREEGGPAAVPGTQGGGRAPDGVGVFTPNGGGGAQGGGGASPRSPGSGEEEGPRAKSYLP